MRVAPRPAIAVGIFVLYALLILILWKLLGVDYTRLGDSAGNVARATIIPIGLGGALLAGITTYLGWWRLALFERERSRHRWPIIAPALGLFTSVMAILGTDFAQVSIGLLLSLVVGLLCVGFAEELLCRGLVLAGLRARFPEAGSWALSVLLFSLLHSVNALVGQSVGSTVLQMFFVTLIGTNFYIVRRVTGSLVWAMGLHMLWDLGTLLPRADSLFSDISSFFLVPAMFGSLFVVRWVIVGARESVGAETALHSEGAEPYTASAPS